MAESDSILAALENCESEPIRTPEAVQPHGCVCVCDLQFEHVTHVSQNAALYFNRPPEDILGQPVNDIFERAFCHAIRNAASLRTVTTHREYLGEFDFGSGLVETVCHQRGPHIIVELGQKNAERARQGLDINRLRWLMSKWEPHEHALSDALDILVQDFRMLTGYSRVMAYRFRPDGSGEVLAESLAPKAESFLGLRFPKWDVPDTARAISLEQPLRIIADVSADDVPLLSWRDNSEPVDMTLAEFRATSPIHKKYLSNMGVGGSMVLPVVHQGKLWGMFSFHHNKPRKFTIQETLSIELAGQMLNAHLGKIFEYNLNVGISRCKSIAVKISDNIFDKAAPQKELWSDVAAEICALLDLDGVVLESGSGKLNFGAVPSKKLADVKEQLGATNSSGIYLAEDLELVQMPGALLLEIEGDNAECIWLFRKEEVSKVNWAGAPKKEIDESDDQTILMPRNSFSSYMEISKGRSRAWEPEDLTMAIALKAAIDQIAKAKKVSQTSISHSEDGDDLLQQQVKFWLHMFQSVMKNVAIGESKYFEKVHAFISILDESLRNSVDLNLRNIISQISTLERVQSVNMSGAEVSMRKKTIFPLMVAVRECLELLGKGQSSIGDVVDHVGIKWEISDRELSIHFSGFRERYINSSKFLNYGLNALEGATSYLSGQIDVDRDSLQISIKIPSYHVIERQDSNSFPQNEGFIKGAQFSNLSPRILVLENNEAFEVELRIMLRRLNILDVTSAKTHQEAIKLIENGRFDLALVNVRLLDLDKTIVLDLFCELNIPCVFLTSFKDEAAWISEYKQPIIVKPIREGHLKEVIKSILHERLTGSTLRVLLIEDSAPLLEQMKSDLIKLGHLVECASCVNEAEEILRELHIDLIVIDIFIDLGRSHVQEGTLRIVSRIRNEIKSDYKVDKDVPILAISGSMEIPGGYSPLKMARQIGADECMQKPLNMKKFINWVSRVADKKGC